MRSSISALLARRIGGLLRTRPASVTWLGGVASFTFDDFPKSALTVGGATLERHGGRGTYYTAMKFAGTANNLGPMFETGDIAAAHRGGHEIACHTRTHLDCRYAKRREIAAEVSENSQAIAELLGDAPPTNFAYPYGAVSLTAKHLLARRFATCRGTGEGINAGPVDLADLSVVTLYASRFDEAALRNRVDEACAGNGWIIFYTHDIADEPSPYGCTPAQLETVVGYAAQVLPVRPVRDVVANLADGGQSGITTA